MHMSFKDQRSFQHFDCTVNLLLHIAATKRLSLIVYTARREFREKKKPGEKHLKGSDNQ